jgi:hypothetical protein
MSKLVKAGRRLELIVNYVNQNHPKDAWILSTIEPLFIDGVQSYTSVEEEQLMIRKLNQLIDAYEFRFGSVFESLTEGLSPEVSKKAVAIFKSMIADKRDSLFKRYGADAEKVAYGHAIAKAKQINEKQTMQQTDKLREMVRAALSTPMDEINSTEYINERESVTEDDWKQPDDESDMAKSQLHNLIKDAQRLESMIVDGEQLDAWVQAKLTKAQDYINSVHNYLGGEQSTKKHVDTELTERIFNRIKNRM